MAVLPGANKIGGLYWVQGHLLNHNIHGPGVPDNLVPICNTTNTNMEAIIERFAKKLVDQGEVVYYEVNAHLEGAKAVKWSPGVYQTVPGQQLKAVYDQDQAQRSTRPWRSSPTPGPSGTPVACSTAVQPRLAALGRAVPPTRLSWRLMKSKNWATAPDWSLNNHAFEEVANSNHISPEQWYKTYPS